MITAEQLISQLQDQIEKLQAELEQTKKDTLDFANIAATWKKGYEDRERDLLVRLKNAELTIEQLQEELEDQRHEYSNLRNREDF